MEIRAYASDEGFEEIYFLVDYYAKLKNPHLFFDFIQTDPLYLIAELGRVDQELKEIMEVGEL